MGWFCGMVLWRGGGCEMILWDGFVERKPVGGTEHGWDSILGTQVV